MPNNRRPLHPLPLAYFLTPDGTALLSDDRAAAAINTLIALRPRGLLLAFLVRLSFSSVTTRMRARRRRTECDGRYSVGG